MKPALLRPKAEADLVEAAAYDAHQGGADLAERMFEAALSAPAPSSACLAWDHPDVVRLLGDRQDIVALLEAGV